MLLLLLLLQLLTLKVLRVLLQRLISLCRFLLQPLQLQLPLLLIRIESSSVLSFLCLILRKSLEELVVILNIGRVGNLLLFWQLEIL